MHVDEATGKETPVMIIQAEENGEVKAVGLTELGTDQLGAALLRESQALRYWEKPSTTKLSESSHQPAVVSIIALHPMRMHITIALAHRLPMAVYRNVAPTFQRQ